MISDTADKEGLSYLNEGQWTVVKVIVEFVLLGLTAGWKKDLSSEAFEGVIVKLRTRYYKATYLDILCGYVPPPQAFLEPQS